MKAEANTRRIRSFDASIVVPGCFVVLQGISGDGMSNTIDTGPIIIESKHEEANDNESESESDSENESENEIVNEIHGCDKLNSMRLMNPPSKASVSAAAAAASALRQEFSFIVVSDEDNPNPNPNQAIQEKLSLSHTSRKNVEEITIDRIPQPTLAQNRAIQTWESTCRTREKQQRKEWLEHQNAMDTDDLWWQRDGKLVVMKNLPFQGIHLVQRQVIGTLPPGTTVVAKQLISLSSTSLLPIIVPEPDSANVHQPGKYGVTQLLLIESPMYGYVVLSMDAYPFLGPGEPALYTDLRVWMWRVTCSSGAFVRNGLELNTQHIQTVPFGSCLQVTRKVINGMGLPRLQIHTTLEDEEVEHDNSEGWISEFLNPLSGQRGPISQPIPFPLPALFQVTLADGAIIRADVELSSSQIGLAPVNTILTVVARAFSDHPQESCIERLKLAGHHGGWVSIRLNKPPPLNEPILEFISMDNSFDPSAPGLWHLLQSQQVCQKYDAANAKLPSSSRNSLQQQQQRAAPPTHNKDDKCLICLTEVRNSTIVHGETGHIACCLICARVLRARGDRCPVCRLPIDCIIQQFWA